MIFIGIGAVIGVLLGIYRNIYPFIFSLIFLFLIYFLSNLKQEKAKKEPKVKNEGIKKEKIHKSYLERKEIFFYDYIINFKLKYILIFVLSTIFFSLYINLRYKNFENKNERIKEKEEYESLVISKEEGKYSNKYKIYLSSEKIFGELKLAKKTKIDAGKIYNLKIEFKSLERSFNPSGFDEKLYSYSKFLSFKGKIKNAEEYKNRNKNKSLLKNNIIFNIYLKYLEKMLKTKSTLKIYFNKYVKSKLALGILLGEKNEIDEKTKEDFMETNIYHVLSISGMHISYIYMFFKIFKNKIQEKNLEKNLRNKETENTKITVKRKRFNIKNINIDYIFLFILFNYIILVGISPSIIRASISVIFFLIKDKFNLSIRFIDILAFSFVVSVLINPFYVFFSGIYLSLFSVLGINIYLYVFRKDFFTNFKKLKEKEKENKQNILNIKNKYVLYLVNILRQSIVISFVVQIFIFPILIYFTNKLSFNFILANVLLQFVMPPLIFLGFLFILLVFFLILFKNVFMHILIKSRLILNLFNVFLKALGLLIKFLSESLIYISKISKFKTNEVYIPNINLIYILIYYFLLYFIFKSIYILKRKKEYILVRIL